MINWKKVAKYFYQQFRLWVKAYNQVADVYMINESCSVGSSCYSVTHLTKRAGDLASPVSEGIYSLEWLDAGTVRLSKPPSA